MRLWYWPLRVVCALAASGLLLGSAAPPVPQPAKLAHLGGIAEIKKWFNAGKGHPRLMFLLSPT